MSEFSMYFGTGVAHITDLGGMDHILFIVALCIRYPAKEWRRLLVLVTAFTIGHSFTLALSTFNVLLVPIKWTEALIAVTIFITAVSNIVGAAQARRERVALLYGYAFFFGLIHGLGFSTLLKSMLGRDQNVVMQLLAFNLGLEAGQLIIVAFLLAISFIFVSVTHIHRRHYIQFASGAVALMAVYMIIERFYFIKM